MTDARASVAVAKAGVEAALRPADAKSSRGAPTMSETVQFTGADARACGVQWRGGWTRASTRKTHTPN